MERKAMKTQARWGLVALLLAVAVAGPARAATVERIGTGGATELRLAVGARSVALGGAVIANAGGAEALFYNPAGVAATDAKTEFTFSHVAYIADMKVNYFGVAQSFGDWGMLGASAKVLSVGDIVRTTEDAPDGTGEIFAPTFATLGLTYSRRMTDRVNFGSTVYYVAERILQETAAGVAFDFGFQYDTGYRGAAIGIAIKNLGPSLKFAGSDFDFSTTRAGDDPNAKPRVATNTSAGFELPTYFQFGASYPLLGQGLYRATAYAAYQNNSFSRDEYRGGLEWSYRDQLALRAGYAATGNQDDLFGFAYGVGIKVPAGQSNLFVDYAGQTVSDFFDDVQHVSLRIVF
jgi:hypothetical protein